jgi:hypothetical protein
MSGTLAAFTMWEQFLSSSLPERHQRALADASDHAHLAVDFLLLSSPNRLLDIRAVNEYLHDSTTPDPWPPFLLAFASNGCADYFAYDLRSPQPIVRYIDPGETVWENLTGRDQLLFGSFSEWYELQVAPKARTAKNRS